MDKNEYSAPWEKDERDEELVQELLEIYGWNDILMSVRDWKQRKKQLYNMTRDALIKINVMMAEKLAQNNKSFNEKQDKSDCKVKLKETTFTTYLTRNVETHVMVLSVGEIQNGKSSIPLCHCCVSHVCHTYRRFRQH